LFSSTAFRGNPARPGKTRSLRLAFRIPQNQKKQVICAIIPDS
jgi:hypothetical protein